MNTDTDPNASPVNPIPWPVLVMLLIIAAVEIALQLGESGYLANPASIGWRVTWQNDFGLNTNLVDWMIQNRNLEPQYLMRFVTYSFVHTSFTHALLGAVFIAAMGKFVGDIYNPVAVLFIVFASTAIGALVLGLFTPAPTLLVGAFPAMFGLIGAYTWIQMNRLQAIGDNPLKAFFLIGFFASITLIWQLVLPGTSYEWIAEFSAFFAGFGLSVFCAPGAMARMRSALETTRQR